MVFAKIEGFALVFLGLLVGLIHFKMLSDVIYGINVITIAIFVFIAHEAYSLFKNLSSGGNKIISIGVPLLFIIIAGSYFIISYLPEPIASNILIITAAIICAEGLYRLH